MGGTPAFAQLPKSVSDTSTAKKFLDYYNKSDTGLSKIITKLLKEEASLKNIANNNVVPLPVDFRNAFTKLIPTIKSEFRFIGSRQTGGDIGDGVTFIPSEVKSLPGTTSNFYESFVDGLTLTYDVTLHAGIDSNLSANGAAKITEQWKSMLQAAFKENSSLFTDKTDNSGNRFVTVAFLTNPANPKYSGGFTLTIQNIVAKERHKIELVVIEKAEK